MLSQDDLREIAVALVGIVVALSVLAVVAAKRFTPRRRGALVAGGEGFAAALPWGAPQRRSAADMRADMLLAAEMRRDAQAERAQREAGTSDADD